jgi:hypothetical protein
MRPDPGILVGETPRLDGGASAMRPTSIGNLAIDVRLLLQILGASVAIGIHGHGNVHLGDVDLRSEIG